MGTDQDREQDPYAGVTGFEEIYAQAGDNLDAIPWAALAPHPALVAWLDRQPAAPDRTALVVGCGLGDDAEETSRRGYQVTAFDLSPTAVAHCRERFPESAVNYQVADLFGLPDRWHAAFDLAVEIRTLQSLPPPQRPDAASAMAATLRPGGRIFVHCLARDDDEPVTSRPWPVSRRELDSFIRAGLRRADLLGRPASPTRSRTFTAVYVRP